MDWLNYHHLNYFWRIAREGTLSRAASTLGVTHSTLSTQLRSLEQFLGGVSERTKWRRPTASSSRSRSSVFWRMIDGP